MRLDIFYIEKWSPTMDMKILLRTLRARPGQLRGQVPALTQ